MGFIERELRRIENLLIREDGSIDERAHAAQQALGWALDPKAFKSPSDYIRGIPSGSEGCSVEIRHSPLQDTTVPISDAV